MRIRFGLILKITERAKSYILPELCYLIKSIGKSAKLEFFSVSIPVSLFEVYPCFPPVSQHRQHLTSETRNLKPLTATTVFVGAIRALSCRNVS